MQAVNLAGAGKVVPPPPSSDANLPRILCLHGGGTSSTIFKIQLRRILFTLRSHFKFVFVSAPFESGPGPGVMPVFAGCDPFFRWMIPDDPDAEASQLEVRDLLKKTILEDRGEFVGVLGFSQGGRLTAGLLADQAEGENDGMPNFKFGVLLCASYPPLSMSSTRKPSDWKPDKADHHGEIRQLEPREIIHIPTVHVTGSQDIHAEKGRRLAGYFDNKIQFEYDMGHHLPGAAGDTTSPKGATIEICEAILKQFGRPETLGGPGGAETPKTPEPELAKAAQSKSG